MNLWTTRENCPNGGQKCLYKFLSETGNTLKGTHTTPIKLYVDDIMYTFTDAGDMCNIYNLVEGANLHKTPSYTETTSDSVCTQYTSR